MTGKVSPDVGSGSQGRKKALAAAGRRLHEVTAVLAGEKLFGGPGGEDREMDLLEEATRMVKAAARGPGRP